MRPTEDLAATRSGAPTDTKALGDLELTRLCAEAMGLKFVVHGTLGGYVELTHFERNGVMYQIPPNSGPPVTYRPLHDDAQCFALVKRFDLWVQKTSPHYWFVASNAPGFREDIKNADLNRAICECVAKMALGTPSRSK